MDPALAAPNRCRGCFPVVIVIIILSFTGSCDAVDDFRTCDTRNVDTRGIPFSGTGSGALGFGSYAVAGAAALTVGVKYFAPILYSQGQSIISWWAKQTVHGITPAALILGLLYTSVGIALYIRLAHRTSPAPRLRGLRYPKLAILAALVINTGLVISTHVIPLFITGWQEQTRFMVNTYSRKILEDKETLPKLPLGKFYLESARTELALNNVGNLIDEWPEFSKQSNFRAAVEEGILKDPPMYQSFMDYYNTNEHPNIAKSISELLQGTSNEALRRFMEIYRSKESNDTRTRLMTMLDAIVTQRLSLPPEAVKNCRARLSAIFIA